MVNYKEILRLVAEGTSQQQIAASVRSSRNKVNEVIAAAKTANIAWPLDEFVTNEQLGAIHFPNRHTAKNPYLEPDTVSYLVGNNMLNNISLLTDSTNGQ